MAARTDEGRFRGLIRFRSEVKAEILHCDDVCSCWLTSEGKQHLAVSLLVMLRQTCERFQFRVRDTHDTHPGSLPECS